MAEKLEAIRVMALSNAVTYFVQAETGGPIKIGKATTIANRLSTLQTGCPEKLLCLGTISGDVEKELHARFATHRLHGEWFAPAPVLLEYIEKHAMRDATVVPRSRMVPIGLAWLVRKWEREFNLKWVPEDEVEEWLLDATYGYDRAGEKLGDFPDDCDCEWCDFDRGQSFIEDVKPLGLLTGDDMIVVVMCWNPIEDVRNEMLRHLAHAHGYMDHIGVSVAGLWVKEDGSTHDAEVFGAWLNLVGEARDER